MKVNTPEVLVVLPIFLQDGIDKYTGIMRFLTENKLRWNIRFDRLAPNWDRPGPDDLPTFDGIIADGLTPEPQKRCYLRLKKPLVTIDWFSHPCPNRRYLAAVNSDSTEIGRMGAKTLLAIGGFASYSFLAQPDKPCWSTDRGAAFFRQMRKNNISDAMELNPDSPLGPQLRQLPKPAAIFAAHDTIAAKALRDAFLEGIAVPDDLSILGVDNETLTCLHTDPSLASIQPDFEQAGFLAAKALHAMMNGHRWSHEQQYHIKSVMTRGSLRAAGTAGKLIQLAMELIHDHALEYKSINQLANQLRVSRRLLDRRFRQVMGRSVLDVMQDVRLGHICAMLETTRLPISEVCSTCGFGSANYLLRFFKKHMGMTMNGYRKRSHALQSTTGKSSGGVGSPRFLGKPIRTPSAHSSKTRNHAGPHRTTQRLPQ